MFLGTKIHESVVVRKGKLDKFTLIIRDFNTLSSVIDKTSTKKKIRKNIDLNTIVNKPDLIDIYRLLCPVTAEYMFQTAGTFTRISHRLGH